MLYPSKTNSLPLVIAAFLLVTIAAATALGKVEVVKIQSGAETAEGVLDKEAAAVRGNTFTLNSIDPGESRHLTVAFDYLPPALPRRIYRSSRVRGRWSLSAKANITVRSTASWNAGRSSAAHASARKSRPPALCQRA